MNSILFIPQHAASLNEMMLISNGLNNTRSIFYISFLTSEEMISNLRLNNSEVVIASAVQEKNRYRDTYFKNVALKFVSSSFVQYIFNLFFIDHYVSRKMKKILSDVTVFDELISVKNIEKVVLTTDRSVGIELSATIAARKRNLDVVIISFAISADVTSSEKLRKSRLYFYEKSDSWNTATLSNGKRISFFKKHDKKTLELLKVNIRNPWVLGAGFCDYMLVDSEREKHRLINLGGDADKYFVTGQMSHDQLFEANKNSEHLRSIYRLKYNLTCDDIILLAVPQYYEHGLCERDKHFTLIGDMISCLSELKVNVILSLHPKMNREDYEIFTHTNKNVIIIDESLSRALPVCDLFISTYSSTVTWALLCNKKVVVVDHVGLRYNDFFSEFNMPVASNNEALLSYVIDILSNNDNILYDPSLLKTLSPFDGLCSERIVKFLSEYKNE